MASTVQALRTWDDAIVLQFSEPNRYEFLIQKTGEVWQPLAVAMSLAYEVAIFAADCLTDPRGVHRADGQEPDMAAWTELTKRILSRHSVGLVGLDGRESLLHALEVVEEARQVRERLSSLFRFVPSSYRGLLNLRFNAMFWSFEQIHEALSSVEAAWWSMDTGIRRLLNDYPAAMGFPADTIPHYEFSAIEKRIRRFSSSILPGKADAVFALVLGSVTKNSPFRPDGRVNTERFQEWGQKLDLVARLEKKFGL